MHHKPQNQFFMSHEVLFTIVIIGIIAFAFILAKVTGSAENISKY